MSVDPQWCSAMEGRASSDEPRMAHSERPRPASNPPRQTHLELLIPEQRNKKRQSFAQPTHGPQARHLSPKKERTKKFTFAHKRIHLHRKPPTKGVHLYNESPQNNHLRIQKRPNPRRRLRHRFIVPPKTARHPLCQNRHRRRLPV